MNLDFGRYLRVRAFLVTLLALWLAVGVVLIGPAQPASGQPLQTIAVYVTENYGGELLAVSLRGGQQEFVRLTGISVPVCIQRRAVARTRALAEGRWTHLELSSQQRDSNGYLAGYIWVDSVMLNLQLVSEGLAAPVGGATRYQQSLYSAGSAARAGLLGGWGSNCLG